MNELTREQIERLTHSPHFIEWLHGDAHQWYQIPVRLPQRMGYGPSFTIATLHLERWQYPAPWAIREYRYVCNVAMCGDREIARSECWPWYAPDPWPEPIPPAEQSRG